MAAPPPPRSGERPAIAVKWKLRARALALAVHPARRNAHDLPVGQNDGGETTAVDCARVDPHRPLGHEGPIDHGVPEDDALGPSQKWVGRDAPIGACEVQVGSADGAI
jgi:hypothetical protein